MGSLRNVLYWTPGRESTDIASVRSLAESSLKTAPTLLSSTPVLWNSPASTCNTICSYLLQLLQNVRCEGAVNWLWSIRLT